MQIQGREFRIYKLYLKTYQRAGLKDSRKLQASRQGDTTIKFTVFTIRFYLFNLILFYILISHIQCNIYYSFKFYIKLLQSYIKFNVIYFIRTYKIL